MRSPPFSEIIICNKIHNTGNKVWKGFGMTELMDANPFVINQMIPYEGNTAKDTYIKGL